MSNIRYHVWLYVGLIVLLLGLQMRMVQTFVFTPESTKVMHDWLGPPATAPTGAIQRFAVDQNLVQKHYRPPNWLGYALMSVGGVMMANGFLRREA